MQTQGGYERKKDQDQDSLLVKRRNDNHSPGVPLERIDKMQY